MSVRLFVLSALTAASAVPAGLVAQERQPVPRPKIYIDGGDGPEVIRDRIRIITQRRYRLGVNVDMRASETDSIGASVLSVTPGGPAAKAGIKSGDVITKINGKSLTATDNTRAGEDESPSRCPPGRASLPAQGQRDRHHRVPPRRRPEDRVAGHRQRAGVHHERLRRRRRVRPDARGGR